MKVNEKLKIDQYQWQKDCSRSAEFSDV